MSVFPSRISLFSGAVALSLLASTATAGTISLTYAGPSVSESNGNSLQTVYIDEPTEFNREVYAFGFNMTGPADTSLASFLAWCLDLGSALAPKNVPATYSETDIPFSNSLTIDTSLVQKVFDANFGGVTVSDGLQAAGFQVALWEAIYEKNVDAEGKKVWDAGDGVFAVSENADVIEQANTYLGLAAGYTDDQKYRLTFLESASDAEGKSAHQNLVTVSPVPLPAAGFLLLAALGGLGFAARRRKAV
ncbi:VPLPA-CTERM sorting domain-containing protein [Yoonia sp.]|uniref:VPLPA-CTERM sorting domain-containing protein n=1 Tax=Yoonia sp. TaxID=2212373 RepID=UPI003976DE65